MSRWRSRAGTINKSRCAVNASRLCIVARAICKGSRGIVSRHIPIAAKGIVNVLTQCSRIVAITSLDAKLTITHKVGELRVAVDASTNGIALSIVAMIV